MSPSVAPPVSPVGSPVLPDSPVVIVAPGRPAARRHRGVAGRRRGSGPARAIAGSRGPRRRRAGPRGGAHRPTVCVGVGPTVRPAIGVAVGVQRAARTEGEQARREKTPIPTRINNRTVITEIVGPAERWLGQENRPATGSRRGAAQQDSCYSSVSSQSSFGISVIQASINATPKSSASRLGSSGILTSGSSLAIRKGTMLRSGRPG